MMGAQDMMESLVAMESTSSNVRLANNELTGQCIQPGLRCNSLVTR